MTDLGPNGLLEVVCRALTGLVAAAQPYEGLFPSLLDRTTGEMLVELPAAIAGQRDGDRSHLGSNLMHDQAALKTMYALAEARQRPDFAAAADRYICRFARHCTDTATGLFPWGEHAYWHLGQDRVGNSRHLARLDAPDGAIHDHLRQAPVWLWEKIEAANPACVQRFAAGLTYHWVEDEPREYIRHAHIEARRLHQRGARACDFPRHSGFYILDWAYAYRCSGAGAWLEQIGAMLDYWWERRDGAGLLPIESRSPREDLAFYDVNAPGQTLSLGTSLLEAAALLGPGDAVLAATMWQRAQVYIAGFLAAPHDLASGVFALSSRRSNGALVEAMPVWGSKYGVWPAAYVALTALCAYRLVGDPRLLDWAAAVGHGYLQASFPATTAVPAMDAGLGLGLLADLYALTGQEQWQRGGLALAQKLVPIYCDRVLPRGAAGIEWYESQMGPSFLLHGLARIALLSQERQQILLEADYTAR